MKHPDNIRQLMRLPIDMMGLIFYPKSPRYVGSLSENEVDEIKNITLAKNVKRVGVFVNESADTILKLKDEFGLDIVQLHGNESPEFCTKLSASLTVIKAFSISNINDFKTLDDYEACCSFFLFDTKTPQYGGSGQKFDWELLNTYNGNIPFLLSGGISVEDTLAIKKINHPQFYGVDLNSRFETEPGLKNITLLEQFINNIRHE